MIHEITQFIDYLEEKSPEIFSESLVLREGLYVFLEKEDEDDELVIKEENILKVDKETERTSLYDEFLALTTNTEMLNAMKSFNSGPKIYIAIGSPFGISISGLGLEKEINKRLDAASAYFKAAAKYVDEENAQHIRWMDELKLFVNTKMFEFIENTEGAKNLKKTDVIHFFLKEPNLKDYQEIQSRFLSEKLFNKDKFNIKSDNGEIFGISDNLSGFNDSKEFLKHQTAPLDLNFRVNGLDAMKLYKFFRLQQKNKILPNPMPLFVDEKELTEKAVKFYKNDKKAGHKEIIEHLLKNREKDLHDYYLIYFKYIPKDKKERIVDLDFVPAFKHKFDKEMRITTIFNTSKSKIFHDKIETVFDFEKMLNDKLFLQYPKNSTLGYGILRENYFSDKIKPYKGYTISEVTINLLYKYRRAIYDFVYKSKHQIIIFIMFNEIMRELVLDDLRHDKFEEKFKTHSKEKEIKEKLNIWFSLYNYFEHPKKTENMVNKTEMLFERLRTIAKPKNTNERINTNDEFAFAAGQLIRTILNKSESGERTHALLEPFLQKTQDDKFKLAIARAFENYKHAFKFYRGDDTRYEFDKIMSEVMGFETKENMKNLLPIILAGYFSETIFKKYESNNNE
jgi:CRISPR-associated protein Csh1